ncbi:TetR family transcriptional regulator [Cutibacterium sp. WCA-380-WT-3A]|uniref:TetR family transcriptional regulator n=1 Tax=Cutibacterium porci TaxID=2605781 RepID=A0A7K0J3Z1_9ACTN|nr:sugar-binding domain-containing protein [Cutibacterium porci]MSS44647.1 TetR family transcriptional regulator [Cutibacterium porci]
MPNRRRASHDEEMLHVAEMYYFEQMTHAAIAQRLSMSRWTVGRILEEARRTGMVKITIDHPLARHHRLETELVDNFGLQSVVVVPVQASDELTMELVTRTAAQRLSEWRPRPRVVAVSWGRTMAHVAQHLGSGWNPDVVVAQTNGGVAVTRNDLVGRSVVRMAERGPGRSLTLQAPTIVESVDLGNMLRQDASVSRPLEAAQKADLVVYSPGAVSLDSILATAGHVTTDGIEQLRNNGASADIMSHYVDVNGDVVDEELDSRTISVDLDCVRVRGRKGHGRLRGRRVLAVASGAEKAEAMGAALHGGLCTDLVIDARVAEHALQ